MEEETVARICCSTSQSLRNSVVRAIICACGSSLGQCTTSMSIIFLSPQWITYFHYQRSAHALISRELRLIQVYSCNALYEVAGVSLATALLATISTFDPFSVLEYRRAVTPAVFDSLRIYAIMHKNIWVGAVVGGVGIGYFVMTLVRCISPDYFVISTEQT